MRRTLLAVLALVLVSLAAGTPRAGAAVEPYQQVADITFPVSGDVRYGDDYHQNRSGGTRKHQATDVLGKKLQPLHAAVNGTICYLNGVDEPMPTWGYSLTICGSDGLSYRYVHINNDNPGTDDGLGGPRWAYAPGIRRGVKVTRGQWVAYMGDSGNAEGTAPHLHFEIRDPNLDDPALSVAPYEQGRRNPFPSLQDARHRGDIPTPPAAATPPPVTTPPVTAPPTQPPPAPAPPVQGPAVRRLWGADRITTAVALSAERDRARTVVIVPSQSHAEALIAAPLAGLVGGPVLLSSPGGLDKVVADEVARLGAINAYVVGRGDQLSDRVADDLRAAGVLNQARLSAPDSAGLSAVVAREMASYPALSGGIDKVFLALGSSADPSRAWPDALSVSALAAQLRAPVLLTPGDQLPPAVADVLAELRPRQVQVVGGVVAISDEVARAAGAGSRLFGDDRYGTSTAVAAEARRHGLNGGTPWLATGRNFPDALAAGPAAARAKAPLLLVDGDAPDASAVTYRWLADQRSGLDGAVLIGGAEAISDLVAQAVARALAR